MIILGLILWILGYAIGIGILETLGTILIVLGVILLVLGAAGTELGGRRYWF